MRKIITVFLLFILSYPADTEIIKRSANLISEITTIRNNMPGANSEGFVLPSEEDLSNWQQLISYFLQADTLHVDSLIQLHFSFYQLYIFTDTGYENRIYYLLREKLPVTKGWGTYIYNTSHCRKLAIEIPHPWYDTNTYSEGADIFRRTEAKYLLMAGTHRCANSTFSDCDGTTSACGSSNEPYRVSDMAHFSEGVFQITHQEIVDLDPETYSINLHGNSNSSCPDIFLSNGRADDSWSLLYELKNNLLASGGLTVAGAGDGSSLCPFIGSTNVQGRYSNGSDNPCNQAATSTTGYFIHIEQSRLVRDNFLQYNKLIDALNTHIPEIPTTRLDRPVEMAKQFYLRAYPNPFNPITNIELRIKNSEFVTLNIYNVIGQKVATLVSGKQQAGLHTVEWDANGMATGNYHYYGSPSVVSSGIYFCVLRSESFVQTIKLLLVR